MRAAPGRSWYGPVNCCTPGEQPAGLFALVHELPDCAVAMLYCEESRTGPVELLAAIPSECRSALRAEFAFEFLAFIRFLGAIGESTALTVHDMIADAIGKTRLEDSLVFSISTGLWSVDLDEVLSRCIERLSAGLLEWVAERKAARLKNGRVNQ